MRRITDALINDDHAAARLGRLRHNTGENRIRRCLPVFSMYFNELAIVFFRGTAVTCRCYFADARQAPVPVRFFTMSKSGLRAATWRRNELFALVHIGTEINQISSSLQQATFHESIIEGERDHGRRHRYARS